MCEKCNCKKLDSLLNKMYELAVEAKKIWSLSFDLHEQAEDINNKFDLLYQEIEDFQNQGG